MAGKTVVSMVDKGWGYNESGKASFGGEADPRLAEAEVTVDDVAASRIIETISEPMTETTTLASLPASAGQVTAFPAPALAEPAADPEVEGYIDGLDARWNVVGWARSLVDLDERMKVELVEDGRAVSSETAVRFRGDLQDAGRGDGKYGFQLAIPANLFDGMRHRFAVRMAPPALPTVLGELDIVLPSRLPKSVGGDDAQTRISAERLVQSVLGSTMGHAVQALESYVEQLSGALGAVARDYDFGTALGLLYVHVLRRRIDEGGLKSRLTQLSMNPDQLGNVVREVVYSDEGQKRLKAPGGFHLAGVEAISVWTRLRPIV
jgi:hypothetical protein